MKVIVLYRVVQHWRASIFEKLSELPNVDLAVYHGPDFEGTKVVGTKKNVAFKAVRLPSWRLSMKATNGNVAMPISYSLLFKLIKASPDIIISEGASNLFNAIIGFIYCKLFGKKFIWWSLGKLQNNKVDPKRKLFNALIQRIERGSDAIVSYSTPGKRYFESIGIPSHKIFVAVNVIDTDKKKLEIAKTTFTRHDPQTFRVLFVGALTKEKKLEILLEAFAKLEQQFDDVYLDLVGGGSEQAHLEDVAKQLGIQKMTFHGAVIDGVGRFFHEADVFVLPGLGGLAISEAMVYGLPVIASIGDGCEADLVDKSNGIIDPLLNADSLLKYLTEFKQQPQLVAEMKAASRYKIDNLYNIHTYLGKIKEAFDYVSTKKSV